MVTTTWPYYFAPAQADAERIATGFREPLGAGANLTDDASIRDRVAALGRAGLLVSLGVGPVRSVAVTRAALAYRDPLDDLAFIIQELGATPLARAGAEPALLAEARAGRCVLAFALTEPDAGSDVRNVRTRAVPHGDHWVLQGAKWFISNAPEADHAVVFARQPDGVVGCFLVDHPEATPQRVAGHSIGRFDFRGAPARLVSPRGLPLALGTLERCRPTVGLAAFGLARRAFVETVRHVRHREQFGAPLAALPVVQHRVAEMAVELETLALPALHACWCRDTADPSQRTGYEAAVGKVVATEAAGRMIDLAVQLHGALGVEEDHPIQALARAVRPLRIYEGATDVLMSIIGGRWVASTTGAP